MKAEKLKNLSVQEALDYAVSQMVKQGGQCTAHDATYCAYADGHGHHCAIGWLMEFDEHEIYDYEMDVYELIDHDPKRVPQVVKGNIDIFSTLQDFHDATDKSQRRTVMSNITHQGFDVSGDHWEQWVQMGAGSDE